jgi:hypothetical protein
MSHDKRIFHQRIQRHRVSDIVERVSSLNAFVTRIADDCGRKWIEANEIGDLVVFLKKDVYRRESNKKLTTRTNE